MRSKAPLALMEQLVMVLVFALSAAFCLRIFVMSDRISRDNEAAARAVVLAQNMAEALKGSSDWEQMLSGQKWQKAGECWQMEYDEDWRPVKADTAEFGMEVDEEYRLRYRMEVWEEDTQQVGLCRVLIRVMDMNRKAGEDSVLFQIPAAWQEVNAHE